MIFNFNFYKRANLIKSLKKVQILINEKDHILFDQLQNKVTEMKFICEQSEIWLTTPDKLNSETYQYKFVIFRVIDILKEFVSLLYSSTDLNTIELLF